MFRHIFITYAALLAATVHAHHPVYPGSSIPCPDGTLYASSDLFNTTVIPGNDVVEPSNDTNVMLTYYWITYQTLADLGSTVLRSCDGKTVYGKSSMSFAKRIRMEGSGHLLNGKMLNLGDCNCGDGTNTFNCFEDITKDKKAPFGFGEDDIPLVPFVSVANNDAYRKMGTWLYAPDFDGIVLPNGMVHNGCLQKVDYIGRGGTPNHIDFFALTKTLYHNTFDSKINKDYITVVWDSTECEDSSKQKGYDITPKLSLSYL